MKNASLIDYRKVTEKEKRVEKSGFSSLIRLFRIFIAFPCPYFIASQLYANNHLDPTTQNYAYSFADLYYRTFPFFSPLLRHFVCVVFQLSFAYRVFQIPTPITHQMIHKSPLVL
jgi:hypothetical protein